MKPFRSLLLVLALFAFSVSGQQSSIKTLSNEANRWFNHPNPSEKTDSKALKIFLLIDKKTPGNQVEAGLICESETNTGVLYELKADFQNAKKYYQKSISTQQKHKLSDTLAFRPLLYLAAVYFQENQVDLSFKYLKNAELIAYLHPHLSQKDRLYNTLGAIYFEGGDYRRAYNYFRRAQELLPASEYDFTFQNNLAVCLQHISQPAEALQLLNELQKTFGNKPYLVINKATVLIDLNQPQKALKTLSTLTEISYQNQINFLRGKAFFAMQDLINAEKNFQSCAANPNLFQASAFKYLAKISYLKSDFKKSKVYIEKAFLSLGIKSPYNFSGKINAIAEKNETLEIAGQWLKTLHKNYSQNPDNKNLNLCISAIKFTEKVISFQAKRLLDQKSKLTFKEKIHAITKNNIDFLTKTFESTGDDNLLKLAFETAENGKGAILSVNLNENNLKRSTKIPKKLLDESEALALARNVLQRRIEAAPSDKTLTAQMRDLDLKISANERKLENIEAFKTDKYAETQEFSLEKTREGLGRKTFIISYFQSEKYLYSWLVSKDQFEFKKIGLNTLKPLLEPFKYDLKNKKLKLRNNQVIYDLLLKDFLPKIPENSHLIIVADGDLNGLPFEVLKNRNSEYLIENQNISYLFSARFLLKTKNKSSSPNLLAMAPFTNKKSPDSLYFLPESETEIKAFSTGKRFLGADASLSNFLKYSGNSEILHLATHAIADNEEAENSYLLFTNTQNPDSKIFMRELRPGMFQNTDLIFLSACSSLGTQYVSGEGLRGLSSGFFITGVNNIISTFWNAEDFTTSYLSRGFYKYFLRGFEADESLRKAKIDFLKDPKNLQFAAPYYWSHLMLISREVPYENHHRFIYYLLAFLILAEIVVIVLNAKKQ